MLATAKVMAFAATSDPARATTFFRDTLGLTLVADEQWALVFDANGTHLRIQKARAVTPPPFTVLGWEVADIVATAAELERLGVPIERYDFVPAEADGIWDAGDGTKVAWFKDPDGNILSITQFP